MYRTRRTTQKLQQRLVIRLQQGLVMMLAWPPAEVVVERLCLASALWWVLQLAPSAGLFESNAAFKDLARFGSEAPWQAGIGTLCILQAVAAAANLRGLRAAILVLFGAAWVFIAGLFYAGNSAPLPLWPHGPCCWTKNTGVGLYAALGVACIGSALHLASCAYLDHLVAVRRKHLTESR